MKKEILFHFGVMAVLFSFMTIFLKAFNLSALSLWLGGVIGTILPDIDHFIYVYFLGPQDATSQRANHLLGNGDYGKTLQLMVDTKYERRKSVFHNAYFHLLFLALAVFVVTSSGSFFGRGLVLAFCLHLLLDQYEDFRNGTYPSWFKNFPFLMDPTRYKLFLGISALVLLLLSFLR